MEWEIFVMMSVCLAGMLTVVQGYSGGAGWDACTTMIPGHNKAGQTGASPFTVTASTTTLTAGGRVDVTISGDSFKGFLIQARGVGSETAYGSWSSVPANTQRTCPGNIAVTHGDSGVETSITLRWQAPNPLPGEDIEFVATVVQSYFTIWVQLKSGSLATPTIPPAQTAAVTTPAQPVTTPAQPVTTPAPQPDISINLADCGTDNTCFRFPGGCRAADCDFIVTWRLGATGQVDFELSARSSGYVAVGFSSDQKMDRTSVTACVIQDSGVVRVSQYYNQGYSSIPVSPDDQLGLSNTLGAHVNGSITCTFTRDVTVTPPSNQVTDLNQELYLLVAVGPTVGGLVSHHSSNPTISSGKVDFSQPLSFSMAVTTTSTPASSMAVTFYTSYFSLFMCCLFSLLMHTY